MHLTTTAARPAPGSSPTRRARPGRDVAAGVVPLAVVAAATCWLLGLPTSHIALSGLLYAVMGALILRFLPPGQPGPGIGLANRITLARSTLALPIAALVFAPDPLTARGAWWVIVLSTAAMILDGLDGYVARRSGGLTAFGARFDMELDALLLLAVSALLWRSGRVGSWVILIGGLRYLFVLAGAVWPVLRGDLPYSRRRKVVCVIQGVALLVCLGPIIPADMAVRAAALALLALTYSFAVDVGWLVGRGPTARMETR